jgi:acetolactate decarboxylase
MGTDVGTDLGRYVEQKAAMRNWILWRLTFLLLVGATGCAPAQSGGVEVRPPTQPGQQSAAKGADALVQFSLLAALAAGDYDDGVSLAEVKKHGDFGLGTFDRLDGEMILLDGEVYQVLADSRVRRRDDQGASPFATVTFFTEDGRFDDVSAATLVELDHWCDRHLPNPQIPVAIRLHAEFEELTLRSAPPQSPPYRPLAEVIDQQVTWQRRNVRGTLIGFRCPEWMGTLNVAGYHWHFLSDDRTIGGHVLKCKFEGATMTYDECATVTIHLPESESFEKIDMSGVSEADVDKIERQRQVR